VIQRFRKMPVVIEAIWYDGTNSDELITWGVSVRSVRGDVVIGTLEDGDSAQVEHVATPGDYIVRGVQGEFYPVKPDIFEATYEHEAQ
jgi:hypothetical protein